MLADPPAAECIGLAATPLAVRDALAGLAAAWRGRGIDPELWDVAEQVLAEALNNVVEHAQAGREDGAIRLETTLNGHGLVCEVLDDGAPMPGGTLPDGRPAELGTGLEDLPEGGFGWFMIRTLARRLSYHRDDGWNRLRFEVPHQTGDAVA
ncbi:MAG: ATP-binding protein [Rhodobacter sp.]|nr:ATP-binding protein [Rhodobacter sp.]